MDRIKRIEKMEGMFDEVTRAYDALEKALDECERVEPSLKALRDYMDSGQWREDFEADERGELPGDLKRGVLSEDGLWNLLEMTMDDEDE